VAWWQFVSPFGSTMRKGRLELIDADGRKLGELLVRLADYQAITRLIPERPEASQRLDGEYVAP
jgi:hypothetical protein